MITKEQYEQALLDIGKYDRESFYFIPQIPLESISKIKDVTLGDLIEIQVKGLKDYIEFKESMSKIKQQTEEISKALDLVWRYRVQLLEQISELKDTYNQITRASLLLENVDDNTYPIDLKQDIRYIGLPHKIAQRLRDVGIYNVMELVSCPINNFQNWPGLSKRDIDIIKRRLQQAHIPYINTNDEYLALKDNVK